MCIAGEVHDLLHQLFPHNSAFGIIIMLTLMQGMFFSIFWGSCTFLSDTHIFGLLMEVSQLDISFFNESQILVMLILFKCFIRKRPAYHL